MNWGYRIALTYIGFMALILTMVVMSHQYEVNLIAKDYYKQEIAYQQEIEKMVNVSHLDHQLDLDYNAQNQTLDLQIPTDQSEGEVVFFRPATRHQDLKMPLALDEKGFQALPVGNLARGLWRLKINWKSGDKAYYVEKQLQVSKDGSVKILRSGKGRSVPVERMPKI